MDEQLVEMAHLGADNAAMLPTQVDALFSSLSTALQSSAHAVVPAGSVAFEVLAWLSLVCYVLFAWVAMHYALKPWAEKVMLASLGSGMAASFLLHLSILSTPSHAGEGPLWKFVSLSRYLPWAALGLGCVYVLYRVGAGLLKRRS